VLGSRSASGSSVLGKGAKPADIPLPIPVLRAVREAVDGRTTGPILRTRTGRRMDRAGASRALTRVAHAAGITRPISPHGLRRTFCTTGLVAGIGIRDMQYAMRHADHARPCDMTWLGPTSTAMPPTPSRPT
jgi:integrase/recombinase XerD